MFSYVKKPYTVKNKQTKNRIKQWPTDDRSLRERKIKIWRPLLIKLENVKDPIWGSWKVKLSFCKIRCWAIRVQPVFINILFYCCLKIQKCWLHIYDIIAYIQMFSFLSLGFAFITAWIHAQATRRMSCVLLGLVTV